VTGLRLAGAAGDGAGRFAVGGATVKIRGASAIFDPLTVGFAGSAVLAHARKDAVAPYCRTLLEGPLHNKLALLLALVRRNYIRKNVATSRDGRI
jgi:hypothetical protein